jgi:hypothetical protein
MISGSSHRFKILSVSSSRAYRHSKQQSSILVVDRAFTEFPGENARHTNHHLIPSTNNRRNKSSLCGATPGSRLPACVETQMSNRPSPLIRTLTPALPNSPTDFLKQQLSKQQNNNFHSSSLKTALSTIEMVSQNVNKTALHPGGVQYVFQHLPIYTIANRNPGLYKNTQSWKRSSMRGHTSTMIAFPL